MIRSEHDLNMAVEARDTKLLDAYEFEHDDDCNDEDCDGECVSHWEPDYEQMVQDREDYRNGY